MSSEINKPTLYIIINNHFDLTWRRCWQRPFTFKGQTFISYTDIETDYLQDNIGLAKTCPDYKFEAESALVVQKAIERRPELLLELQALAREGRFAITGGGEAIVDSNMITGESLLRNYVDGLLWVEQVFGQKTQLAVRNDAFGNSAQLPQILRGVEIAWATGMSYSPAEGLYWRGLDGSTILHQTLPVVAQGGGFVKYPPCATCHGSGEIEGAPCPTCFGRGIDPNLRAALPETPDADAVRRFGAGLVWITPEELLPNPELLHWVEAMQKDYDVHFALEEDVLPAIRPWLDAVDHPEEDLVHPGLELNPNNSGCLVTRIHTKQTVRRQEYALFAAEALSVMAALKGAVYPKEHLQHIRQNQYFTMFHDAITATHVDPAYQELLDIYQTIDQDTAALRADALDYLLQPGLSGEVSVINPTGESVTALCHIPVDVVPTAFVDEKGETFPVLDIYRSPAGEVNVDILVHNVPPFSAVSLEPVDTDEAQEDMTSLPYPLIENSRFRILADAHGLLSVFDKVLGRDILVSGDYRPGELILEHDEGSPWATLNPDQQRIRLADYTHLTAAASRPGLQRLTFSIVTPHEIGYSGSALSAELTVTLVEGLERIDFSLHAAWGAFNHRLRVAMPVPLHGPCQHRYEIPYGVITRQPYTPSFRWAGANGDWPAINWAGVEQVDMSVALFNQGTPSYRIENAGNTETILLSLLRSPCIPTYLHEPYFYTMTDYDGMRDEGDHDFSFAVSAYPTPFAESPVVLDANAYNAGLLVAPGHAMLPPLPALASSVARISAVKWAEANDGLVLRLVEFRGQGGEVVLKLPFPVKSAEKVNLLERQGESIPLIDQSVSMTLRPWEIATVKLVL